MPTLSEMICGGLLLFSVLGTAYLLNDSFRGFVDQQVTPPVQQWTTDRPLPRWEDFQRGFEEGKQIP